MSYSIVAVDVSLESMQRQIDAAGIANDGIYYTGSDMRINGTFTTPQEVVIDGFVTEAKIDYARGSKLADVVRQTNLLINLGFSHTSKQFPLVLDSRSNYIGIQVFGGYPYKIQNINQTDVLAIADQTAYTLFTTDGMSRYTYIKSGESDLIELIRDAVDIAAVNAIIDSRV